jgi:hypothetical protein
MWVELSPEALNPKLKNCLRQINEHIAALRARGQDVGGEDYSGGITLDYSAAFLTARLTDGRTITATCALDAHHHPKPRKPNLRAVK